MATNKFSLLSPGIYNFITDVSQLPARAQAVGGGFVGTSLKGPAFRKILFNNFQDFTTIFGGFNPKMFTPYAIRSYIGNAPIGTFVRVLGKGDPNNAYNVNCGRLFDLAFGKVPVNNSSATAASFSSNLSAVETIATLRSRTIAGVDVVTDVTLTGSAASFSATIAGQTYVLSLDVTQKNYIKNILGTDPQTVYPGDSATGVYVDSVLDYRFSSYTGAYTGSTYGSNGNTASASVTGLRYVTGGYQTATTPWIVSQPYVSGTAVTIYNLFQLISLTDGEASNFDVKVSIKDIETVTLSPKIAPQFTVVIRAYSGDTDKRPIILEQFRVSLDPTATNFIKFKIGDAYTQVQINTPGDVPATVDYGDYPNKSAFVRVSLNDGGYNFDSRPAGFVGPKGIDPFVSYDNNGNPILEQDCPYKVDHIDQTGFKNSKVFLGFDFESANAVGFADRLKGTFTALAGTLPSRGFLITATTAESTFWNPSVSAAFNASVTSNYTMVDVTITGSTSIVQNGYAFSIPLVGGFDGIAPSISIDKAINDGSLSSEYISALNVLANPDECQINLLAAPGVHSGASPTNNSFVSQAITMVETRGDAFYIADIGQSLTPSAFNITTDAQFTAVADAVQSVAGYDTFMAAAYYPWLRIYDDTAQKMIPVPPSVEVAGVYAFTDKISQPWFAPAGFNRATLSRVLQVRKRLTQGERDTLYVANVNPIAFFVGQGIVVYGQKTLQKQASALDRVNVVRLLIEAMRVISGIGRTQQFEPNDAKTRTILSDAINAYLARVQAQRGLYNFKVIIDETNNGPDVVDRNELHGYIALQPTKAAEIIVFNYVITRTGASFEQVLGGLNL